MADLKIQFSGNDKDFYERAGDAFSSFGVFVGRRVEVIPNERGGVTIRKIEVVTTSIFAQIASYLLFPVKIFCWCAAQVLYLFSGSRSRAHVELDSFLMSAGGWRLKGTPQFVRLVEQGDFAGALKGIQAYGGGSEELEAQYDEFGGVSLMAHACKIGRAEIVEALIEKGIHPWKPEIPGHFRTHRHSEGVDLTPLGLAIVGGQRGVIECIVDKACVDRALAIGPTETHGEWAFLGREEPCEKLSFVKVAIHLRRGDIAVLMMRGGARIEQADIIAAMNLNFAEFIEESARNPGIVSVEQLKNLFDYAVEHGFLLMARFLILEFRRRYPDDEEFRRKANAGRGEFWAERRPLTLVDEIALSFNVEGLRVLTTLGCSVSEEEYQTLLARVMSGLHGKVDSLDALRSALAMARFLLEEAPEGLNAPARVDVTDRVSLSLDTPFRMLIDVLFHAVTTTPEQMSFEHLKEALLFLHWLVGQGAQVNFISLPHYAMHSEVLGPPGAETKERLLKSAHPMPEGLLRGQSSELARSQFERLERDAGYASDVERVAQLREAVMALPGLSGPLRGILRRAFAILIQQMGRQLSESMSDEEGDLSCPPDARRVTFQEDIRGARTLSARDCEIIRAEMR